MDAYNKNGMEAVLTLLANSADQSGIMAQMEEGEGAEGDPDIVWHQGKKYNRVQIEGIGDEQDYLMDEETCDIYTLDFKFVANLNDNLVIQDED